MNRFIVFPCMKKESEDGKVTATVVSFISAVDSTLVLFFPITDEAASIINHVLHVDKNKYIHTSSLDVYKTMIDSWSAGGRFLSGVMMDAHYDKEIDDNLVGAKLIISNRDGQVDSLVKVNFIHGVVLAALERTNVIFTDLLLEQLMPEMFDDDEEFEDDNEDDQLKDKKSNNQYPSDPNIKMIAKQILDGQIKPEDLNSKKVKKPLKDAKKDPPKPRRKKPGTKD